MPTKNYPGQARHGIAGNSIDKRFALFVVFLALANGGTGAATHMVVTSVTLGGVAQTSPVLPARVGTVAAGIFSELHLQFDGSRLTLGRIFF